ncbi:MAG: hydantoinase B/oxoprolinase family protein [Runella sp.]
MWQIWIDTGGTFTDCIALTPANELKRQKVLSSSFLRSRIGRQVSSNTYQMTAYWHFDPTLLVGFEARVVGQYRFFKVVEVIDDTFIFSEDISAEVGQDIEFTTHEEAPILATRLITQTPVSQPFPPLTMRLGTTKGTNALLEGKGAAVCLVVTRGFKDLLRIGTQQRPELFQLAIPDPILLYDKVIEIDERIDATGNILSPLTIAPLLPSALNLKDYSIAISLLNSYVNPTHEQQLEVYFQQESGRFVSSSSALYAGINYLKRTQTAVVNAYLQPILSHYLDHICQSLGQDALQVMTSAGSLVKASKFRAKDSLLSGPAGGMVGAAAIAQRLGFERCLTFDMGGTSTDTARFDGKLDLTYETHIEGLRFHNPTLAIETVAAGGGSICSFDGQKLQVGPESAGASPGPACYGAGGPLTITDVNVLLGKLDTSRFGIPIRVQKAYEALHEIQAQIAQIQEVTPSEEELLRGFEQIANEKMAEAIRRISIAKGFNPNDYPLVAFGGAGGLHGCQLADMLGISTVILPYDAGLLSAFGIGQARIERIVSKQILKTLDGFEKNREETIDQLITQGNQQLSHEGIKNFDPNTLILFYLRFVGQETTIEIEVQKDAPTTQIVDDFRVKYQQIYGYSPTDLEIEVESVKVVVGEQKKESNQKAVLNPQTKAIPLTHSGLYPNYDWETLQTGEYFDGPAVLLNPTSTSFIPLGWQAVVASTGDIVVQKTKSITQENDKLNNEAIELELFTNRFMAIAEEMGAQLQRTAFSVNIKERLDFSCALLDREAELLVNAPHIPVHLGSLGVCTRLVLQKIPINPGDVVITNHPRYGGSHLPDVTLISGVFTPQHQLIGYVVNRAHHAEIGGKTPGSMPPDAQNLAEEGVVILPTYLVKNGQIQWKNIETLFINAPYPTRALTENLADINAALASLKSGETALQTLVAHHGLEKVQWYMKRLKDSTFEALQKALQPYQNQVYEATESLDDGHQMSVKIIPKPQSAGIFDFRGTSPRHPQNLNANLSIIYSTILYVLRLLVGKNIPLNEGLLRGIEIILPDDSFLHPHFDDDPTLCPAVVGGNTEVSQRLTDTLLKAFGLAACSQGTMNNLLFGNDSFGYYETICGGTGATPHADGRSAVHQHMTNTRITDPEELERRYPVRLRQFSIREGSGGKGKWNGGDGVIREIEFLCPLHLTLLTQHRIIPPYGLANGEPGKVGKQILLQANGQTTELKGMDNVEVKPHDRLVIETPGGGGYGRNKRFDS